MKVKEDEDDDDDNDEKNCNWINITHPHTGGLSCSLTSALAFDLAILFAQFVFIVVVVRLDVFTVVIVIIIACVCVWWECEWTSATVTCGTSYMHYSRFVPSNGRTWVLFVTHCALDAVWCVCVQMQRQQNGGNPVHAWLVYVNPHTARKEKEENKWKQRSNSTGKKKATWSMSFGAEESRCERWEKKSL